MFSFVWFVAFALFVVPFASAQETAEVRTLRWSAVDYADRYELVIEKTSGAGKFESYGSMEIAGTEMSLPFLPGVYRWRVLAIDAYGNKSAPSPWVSFEVAPKIVEPPAKETEIKTEIKYVPVEEKPPGPFRAALAFAPAVPLYGAVNELLDIKLYPVGLDFRFSYLPFRFHTKRFAFGFALGASWAEMSVNIPKTVLAGHIFAANAGLAAEIALVPNRLALGLRAEGGTTFYSSVKFPQSTLAAVPLDFFIHAGGGVSVIVYINRSVFVEAACGYAHIFTADSPMEGFLRPHLGFGVRF
jgi:hypothetical protein